jgi:hypothetical protein
MNRVCKPRTVSKLTRPTFDGLAPPLCSDYPIDYRDPQTKTLPKHLTVPVLL